MAGYIDGYEDATQGHLRVILAPRLLRLSDVVRAVICAHRNTTKPFEVYVATGDYITVREIADIGGSRGWKGDVPVVRIDTERIRRLGWANNYSPARPCGAR